MSDKKAKNAMNLEQIRSLLELLAEYDVSEFRYEDEAMNLKLRVGAPVVAAPAMIQAPRQEIAAPAPVAQTSGQPAATNDAMPAVESPMVGTFYRSPSPDAPPFVEVGARVTEGQVLCIVEAMKLMNEIESDLAGTVVEVLVDNAQPVQFGQPLFRVRPD